MPDVSAAMAEAEAEEREVAETMAADQDALDVTEREYASGLATEANASAKRSSAFQREMPQPVVISRESASAAGDDGFVPETGMVNNLAFSIDVSQAEASVPADRERILTRIREGVGYGAIDRLAIGAIGCAFFAVKERAVARAVL